MNATVLPRDRDPLLPRRPKGMGKGQKNETHKFVAHTTQKKIKSLKLEALADKSLPKSDQEG